MTIKFDYSNKNIKNKNEIYYIYDKISKRHTFISKEIMDYLKNAERFNMTLEQFIDSFELQEDKKYIEHIISNLKQIGFIKNLKYDEQFKYKKDKNFDVAYISLTNKCNLNCKHCSTKCSPKGKEILSKEKIKNIIANLKQLKPKIVIFTGGEPLIRDDLEEILKFAKENLKESKFSLSTNATLIDDKNLPTIKNYFDYIDISIDGIDEESCSKVRGRGVFSKVMESIKLLKKNEVNNISLSMVFGSKNLHLKSEFLELNKKLGTEPIERALVPEGRALDNILEFYNEKTHLPNTMTSIYDINNEDKKISKKISSCSCNAFESSLFIDEKGDAYPCASLLKDCYKIMNLSYERYTKDFILDKISMTGYKFAESLEYKDTKCESCDLNIFCWNCPAHFEQAKKYDEINNWCKLMKSDLEKIVWG